MDNGKYRLKKARDCGFGHDVYLLGADKRGTKFWLEAPSWACDWYWAFGYVETYTQNWAPSKARDIASHQHIDSSFMDIDERYYPGMGGHYANIYGSPQFGKTTFSEKEGWRLGELFKQFYIMQRMAEFCHDGGAHIAESGVDHGDLSGLEARINKEMIPRVTAAVIKILAPEA